MNNPDLSIFFNDIIQPNDIIVSLNYDCLLEGVLDFYDVWKPNNGYAYITNPLDNSINPNNIQIYKIHGSENFRISSSLPNNERKFIGYEINDKIFPKSGVSKHFGGGALDPEPYLIAPSYVKIPHATMAIMMNDLLIRSKDYNNLIIIGCGLRDEDVYLRQLIISFLSQHDIQKRLFIVDPNSIDLMKKIDVFLPVPLDQVCGCFPISGFFNSSIVDLKNTI
jgi:hypothetical protein